MADITSDPSSDELRAHRSTFVGFERLVLVAVLHIALVLGCLALAFLGREPLIAVVLGVGGSLALIATFAIKSMSAD